MKVGRLALSIYLVALVQLVAAWLGFMIADEYLAEPPGRVGRGVWEIFAAQHVAFDRNRPAALRDTMEWLEVELGLRATLFSAEGKVIASTHQPVPSPVSPDRLRSLPIRNTAPSPVPNTYLVGIHDDQGRLTAYVITDEFRLRRPLTQHVLFVIGLLSFVLIGSLAFARSLAKPLERLARAARAFGQGDLGVRTGLSRRDELGDVARAFDDMAERITSLIQTQRELLANVSHELRTPLARIRVALDLALEGDANEAQHALASITTDWGDLERLVEDVLAAARLDLGSSAGGHSLVRRDAVDLDQLVEDVATRFALVYPKSVFDLELPGPLPRIVGDRTLLKRVLDNLLDNARKYSEADRRVRLRVECEPELVRFLVSDQGMGIEASDLPHIFTPFFRADRSRTRKTGGVGLGLALVRRIVTAHGGSVDVESAPGKGTTMTVSIPRTSPPSSSPSQLPVVEDRARPNEG